MTNIWSNNKYIELTINIMLFLLGINFMHLGQFFLPLICLLLFIDRKFKFKVNDISVFIILCLFAISFFIFSYKLGLYAVMGFTLPMAYYIGSNMNEVNQKNIKYVIYILALGMATYLLINFAFELTQYPLKNLFGKVRRYDIWTRELIRPTIISVNAYLLISIFYYVIRFEKNRLIKLVSIILFVNVIVYNIALSRRTILLVIALSFVLCFILDILYTKNIIFNKKIRRILLSSILLISILGFSIIYFDLFGVWTIFKNTGLYDKIISYGIRSDRLDYLVQAIKLAPYHLWGGQEISNIIGIQIHDLWSDIFDYAGIIPWLLILTYSIKCISTFISCIKNKQINKNLKLMFINLFVVILISLMMEPAFTSTSIYVIIVVLLFTCLEKIKTLD